MDKLLTEILNKSLSDSECLICNFRIEKDVIKTERLFFHFRGYKLTGDMILFLNYQNMSGKMIATTLDDKIVIHDVHYLEQSLNSLSFSIIYKMRSGLLNEKNFGDLHLKEIVSSAEFNRAKILEILNKNCTDIHMEDDRIKLEKKVLNFLINNNDKLIKNKQLISTLKI